MDWIEKALGKRKPQRHATDEERIAARRESQKRYRDKLKARKDEELAKSQVCNGGRKESR